MIVMKKADQAVTACCLGEDSVLEQQLLREGKIRRLPDGRYEILSREAKNGIGQLAQAGDYVKIDTGGCPYPNERAYFLQHHERRGEAWVQIPIPLSAWQMGEQFSEPLRFALDQGLLEIHEDDPERCFRSRQWSTELSAPADAVVVFYRIERDDSGEIRSTRFNFVVREEFEESYQILSE